jgi:hypothetical protein
MLKEESKHMANSAGGGDKKRPEAKDAAAAGETRPGTDVPSARFSNDMSPATAGEADAPVTAKSTAMTADTRDHELPIDVDDERPGLGRDVQTDLGRRLRKMFDEVAKAPVPDKFLKLLEALEQQERRR